jgi:D-alanyl-D-alanine dipeptidase
MRATRTTGCSSSLLVWSAILVACASPPVGSPPAQVVPAVNTTETGIAPDAVADTLLTEIRSLDSTIVVDMRYATSNNFTGAPLPGYLANRAYLRREAAASLARVQRTLRDRGLGINLTLIDFTTGRELEMGTPFDTFSSAAHTANASGEVAANRQALKSAMEREGFMNYDQEWWHFSFNVPNPLRFDRVIR